MPASEDYVFHPAPRHKDELPATAVLICEYGVYVGVDDIVEAAYLNRGNERDELWTVSIEPMRLAISRPARGEAKDAALELLDVLFRSRVGFMWPTTVEREGLIGKADFKRVLRKISRELAANRQEAQHRDAGAEIVVAARDLHLGPEPTGTGRHHWQARCPGTNHHLLIQSATNQFGCGYCRRKGGPEELRAFALEHQARTQSGSRRTL